MNRHFISLLILLAAFGFYAVGLAKPAAAFVFIAMGLELCFWARVSRDIKAVTVTKLQSNTKFHSKSNQKGVMGF
jgi:hypothetical protein